MDREIELYEELVRTIGFDSAQPGWSERLRKLHIHSRERRLQVVPEFFYTSVFSPATVDPAAWDMRFDFGEGVFDVSAQAAYLEEIPPLLDELAQFSYEASPDIARYFWGNDQFSHADAAIHYALLRHVKPRLVVEIGCGHSTKLALEALRRNGAGEIHCIEPYPPAWFEKLRGPIERQTSLVQDVPLQWFAALQPGDILFIDSSHISKTGSDVNYLFLKVLPHLAPGVIVHVHDICLPYEYPRYWSEDVLCYWNEQYVLAGLLASPSRYEVLVGTYFLQKSGEQVLRRRVPPIKGVFPGGGSIWLRVRG